MWKRILLAAVGSMWWCLYATAAFSGEVSMEGGVSYDSSDNASITQFIFYNPNDISVTLSFVLLNWVTPRNVCIDDPGCTSPPGIMDQFEDAEEVGIQTVMIEPLAQFRLSLGGFLSGVYSDEVVPSVLWETYAIVQATWADDILGADGSLRKVTPIKAFATTGNLTIDGYVPTALKGGSITQYK